MCNPRLAGTLLAIVALTAATVRGAEPTVIRITDKTPVNDAHGATTWFRLNDDRKQMMLDGGRYTILSGPSRGTTGRIKGISTRSAEHKGKIEEFMYFEHDREVTPDEPNIGLLIECDRRGDGQMHTLDGYWCSEHNRPNVLFHAAGQAANSWLNGGVMSRVPNADLFGVAPYIIQGISKDDMTVLDSDAKLFRWACAWTIFRSMDEEGAMHQNFELAQKHHLELSIYEVNHHITHGDGPLEPRNKIVTSIGGGLNVCGNMLLMLKEHHLRTQALFSLVQHSYNAHGIGPVRLWGTALNMRQGNERYRPTFLACALANRVMGGRLVETVHSHGEPMFTGRGKFRYRGEMEDYGPLPVLWSYAFRDGDRRGLVVLNIDVAEAHPVAVAFDGKVNGGTAKRWRLVSDSVTANNEFEQPEPQVRLVEDAVEDFAPSHRFTLPTHSAMALEWQVE